jgi:ABC-type sugar transport system permease subunit
MLDTTTPVAEASAVSAGPTLQDATRTDRLRRPRRRNAAARREFRAGIGMAAPAIILLTLFLVVPVLLAFGLSFTNARLISPNAPRAVGFDNFFRAFEDPVFLQSLWNTFAFALVIVPVQSALGLLLAVLVNQRIRGVFLYRVIYFIPVVTSIVVVSILWKLMYREDGLINSFLDAMTFGAWNGVDWLGDQSTALPAIMVLSIWQAVGFHMIIWLSGLQTIPEELYEAARMDGANRWRQFTNVTWPGLRPTMIFVLITITIDALRLFVQVDVMTQGGPIDATTTLVYHAVRVGYRQQEVGYGATISLIFFVLVLIVALVQRWLTREKD